MTTKDGGQAFPSMTATGHKDYAPGLSIRDWFAGQALANQALGAGYHNRPELLAAKAYEYADAMLRYRESGKPK